MQPEPTVALDEAIEAAAPLLYEADRDKDETVPWGDFRPTDVASIVLASVSKIRATIAVRAAAPIIAAKAVEQLVADLSDHIAALEAALADAERERDFWHEQQKLAANVAAFIAELDETAPALRQMLRTERKRREAEEATTLRLEMRLADAERDALNRAADIVGAMPYDAYAYEAEALLRERAKAVKP